MLQEDAKQMFKEQQGWILPVSEFGCWYGINFAPIRRKNNNNKKVTLLGNVGAL